MRLGWRSGIHRSWHVPHEQPVHFAGFGPNGPLISHGNETMRCPWGGLSGREPCLDTWARLLLGLCPGAHMTPLRRHCAILSIRLQALKAMKRAVWKACAPAPWCGCFLCSPHSTHDVAHPQPLQYRGRGSFGRCEVRNGEMWHSKIVPHFAVVFKDRSHVLAFTKSMHIFSALHGSEGLNCPPSLEHPLEWDKNYWGHHVFTVNPVSQVSRRESR